jgi:nucleoside-diphosphate-sugar epimerase
MTQAAANRQPVIYGDGEQRRDFIFVKDVVKANLLAGSVNGVGGNVFNVGTGASISINLLWSNICKISGCRVPPAYADRRPGDIVDSVAGTEKTRSALGFQPDYSFEEGIERTYRWYKETKIY